MTGYSIEFVQPSYAKYREPLYKQLVENYEIRFHFLKEIQPGKAEKKPSWLPYVEYGGYRNVDKILMLAKEILSSDTDAIVTSISDSPQSVLLSTLSKFGLLEVPIVLWSEEWRPRESTSLTKVGIQGFLFNRPSVSKFVLSNVDSILLPHEKWDSYWEELGANKENIFYVSQCSKDYSKLACSTNEKIIREIQDETVILYLGDIIERKGLDLLIESFANIDGTIDDTTLLVVGDGPFRSYCETLAKELDISNIIFTGRVPEEDIPIYYEYSDIFVLPSTLRGIYEPCPIAVLEAMSKSLPVIVSDAVGSANWLVKEGENGYVVPEGDTEKLNSSLQELITNSKKRKKYSSASRELFDKWNDFDYMYSGFEEGIKNAVGR